VKSGADNVKIRELYFSNSGIDPSPKVGVGQEDISAPHKHTGDLFRRRGKIWKRRKPATIFLAQKGLPYSAIGANFGAEGGHEQRASIDLTEEQR